jgi:hypothetical protein
MALSYAQGVRSPKVRPTFELSAAVPPPEVVACIRAKLPSVKGTIVAQLLRPYIELVPHPSMLHSWSPQLRLDLTEKDGGTLISGRFAPHPHVWSLYLAIHTIGAFGTIGAAMFGYSQHLVGQTPWALWALPSAPVLAALVWTLAFVGQGLAAEQMYLLRRFVEESLETASTMTSPLREPHQHEARDGREACEHRR